MSDAAIKPNYIKAKEVAQLLTISEASVYKHAEADSLPFPAYRIGRSWRFKVDEVEQFLGVSLAGGTR